MSAKSDIFQIFKSCFLNIYFFVASIILTPLVFFLLIFLSPIYVFRYVIAKSARYIRPDLGKILTAHSTVMGVDSFDQTSYSNIYVVMLLEGDVPIESVRQTAEEIIGLKDSRGEYVYPEITQTITKFMGFLFWKWDRDFDLKKHVKYFNPSGDTETFPYEEFTEDEFRKSVVNLNQKSFRVGSSPWEIILFKNYKPKFPKNPGSNQTLVVFRFAHALMDGYSYIKMFARHILKDKSLLDKMPIPTTFRKQSSGLNTLITGVWTLLKVPFEATKCHLSPLEDNDGWRKRENQKTNNLILGLDRPRDLKIFKDIKTSFKVSLTSVFFAGIAGGTRKMMIQQGLRLPKSIRVVCPFPMPNHPDDKFRNYMSWSIIDLPIEEEDPVIRLQTIENIFKAAVSLTVPLSMFVLAKCVGSLFVWMIRPFGKIKNMTALASNLPTIQSSVSFMGYPVTEVFFAGNLLRGDIGIIFNVCTFDGNVRYTVKADTSVIKSEEEMEQLVHYMECELNTLKRLEAA